MKRQQEHLVVVGSLWKWYYTGSNMVKITKIEKDTSFDPIVLLIHVETYPERKTYEPMILSDFLRQYVHHRSPAGTTEKIIIDDILEEEEKEKIIDHMAQGRSVCITARRLTGRAAYAAKKLEEGYIDEVD